MASLKEIKNRIHATASTQKVTSAMRMVASANLSRVAGQMATFRPYRSAYAGVVQALLTATDREETPLAKERQVRHTTLVAFTSDSGLCGAFNTNLLKLLDAETDRLLDSGVELTLIPVGKKAVRHAAKDRIPYVASAHCPSVHSGWAATKALAHELIDAYLSGKTDRVMLLHNHYVNNVRQQPLAITLLPVLPQTLHLEDQPPVASDYLIEPNHAELLRKFLPEVVCNEVYHAALDSSKAEFAARMVAMQMATDNAEDLLTELNILYNKQRQQKITSELLDMVGGSEGLG